MYSFGGGYLHIKQNIWDLRGQQEIAYFSYDEEHKFRLDSSSLRYYYTPRLGADLSEGFDTFVKLDDTEDDHLDSLLNTILETEKQVGSKLEADIITWRGMMTKVSLLTNLPP